MLLNLLLVGRVLGNQRDAPSVDLRVVLGLVLPTGWRFHGARRRRGGEQACGKLSGCSCAGHVRRRGESVDAFNSVK